MDTITLRGGLAKPRIFCKWFLNVLKTKCLVLILLLSWIAACTTVNSRNEQILSDYASINWQDGIDDREAYYILRHYVHIQNKYYGIRYLYPEIPDEQGEQWVFTTTFRNSSYERDPGQILTLYIDKTTGDVSAHLPRQVRGRQGDTLERVKQRYQAVNRKDGIDRSEAIAIVKYHYFIEAKGQYWMYNMTFVPSESKRFWIFELIANPRAGVSPEKMARKLKKIEGLYLVVNKKTGELSKERSYFAIIK